MADIVNTKSNTIISGTNDNDYIENGHWYYSSVAKYVTINSINGNDSITNYGDYANINSGDGDDYIFNGDKIVTEENYGGDYITINSGNGALFY